MTAYCNGRYWIHAQAPGEDVHLFGSFQTREDAVDRCLRFGWFPLAIWLSNEDMPFLFGRDLHKFARLLWAAVDTGELPMVNFPLNGMKKQETTDDN